MAFPRVCVESSVHRRPVVAFVLTCLLFLCGGAIASAVDIPTVGATSVTSFPGINGTFPTGIDVTPPVGEGGNGNGFPGTTTSGNGITGGSTTGTGDPGLLGGTGSGAGDTTGGQTNLTPGAPGPTISKADAVAFSHAIARSCIVGTPQATPSGVEGVLSDLSNPAKLSNPGAPSLSDTAYKISTVIWIFMAAFSLAIVVRSFLKEGGADIVARMLAIEAKAFVMALSFLALQFAAGEGMFHNAQSGQSGGNAVYAASGLASKIASAFSGSIGLSNATVPMHNFQIRTPGDAFATGTCMGWKVFAAPINASIQSSIRGGNWFDPIGSVTNFVSGIAGAGSASPLSVVNGLATVLMYAAIAFQIFLVKWNAIVFGSIGIVFLGFAVWDVTAPWAAGYWKFFFGNFVGTITVTIVTMFVTALLDATELKIFNDMAWGDAAYSQFGGGHNLGFAFMGSLELFFVVIFCIAMVIAIPAITGLFLGTGGGLTAGNLLGAAGLVIGGSAALATGMANLGKGLKTLTSAIKSRSNPISDTNSAGNGQGLAAEANRVAAIPLEASSASEPLGAPATETFEAPKQKSRTSNLDSSGVQHPASAYGKAEKTDLANAEIRTSGASDDSSTETTDGKKATRDRSPRNADEPAATHPTRVANARSSPSGTSAQGHNGADVAIGSTGKGETYSSSDASSQSSDDQRDGAIKTALVGNSRDELGTVENGPASAAPRINEGGSDLIDEPQHGAETAVPSNDAFVESESPSVARALEQVAEVARGANDFTLKSRSGTLDGSDYSSMAQNLKALGATYDALGSTLNAPKITGTNEARKRYDGDSEFTAASSPTKDDHKTATQPGIQASPMSASAVPHESSPTAEVSSKPGTIEARSSRLAGAQKAERKSISANLQTLSDGLSTLQEIQTLATDSPTLAPTIHAAAQSLASAGANVATGITPTSAAALEVASQQVASVLEATKSSGLIPQHLSEQLGAIAGELEVQSSYAPVLAAQVAQISSGQAPISPPSASKIANPRTGQIPFSPTAEPVSQPPNSAATVPDFGPEGHAAFESLMARAFTPHTQTIVDAMTAQTSALQAIATNASSSPMSGSIAQVKQRSAFHQGILTRNTTFQQVLQTIAPDHHHSAPGIGRIEKH